MLLCDAAAARLYAQIVRLAIQRNVEFRRLHARSFRLGLIVAGEKTVRLSRASDSHRLEMCLEELASFRFVQNVQLRRLRTDAVQSRIHWTSGAPRFIAIQNRVAALAESGERSRVIIVRPAIEIGKTQRLDVR